jgi:hypothetical protein
MLQQNALNKGFEEYIEPITGYGAAADVRPVPNHVGDTLTLTRPGLLAANPDPVDPSQATGLDNGMTPDQFGDEQYTITLELFNGASDIDIKTNPMAIVDRFAQTVKAKMVQAANVVDKYQRNCLFGGLVPSGRNATAVKFGYLSGTTIVLTAYTAATTITVEDVSGFQNTVVNGVLTPVSAANPIPLFRNGTQIANVIGYTQATLAANQSQRVFVGLGNGGRGISGTLLLDTAVSGAVGDVVQAAFAPLIVRPNGKLHWSQLTASDHLVDANILDAVAYLRDNAIEPVYEDKYLCICDRTSVRQLFSDADFKQVLQTRIDSPEFRMGHLAEGLGVVFKFTTNAPIQPISSQNAVAIRRPIIVGRGALVDGPSQANETFASINRNGGIDEEKGIHYTEEHNGIVFALRPPIDRNGRVMSVSFESIRGCTVPTDLTAGQNIIGTGSNALIKRGVVIEVAA